MDKSKKPLSIHGIEHLPNVSNEIIQNESIPEFLAKKIIE
jgi:hypothetical protein